MAKCYWLISCEEVLTSAKLTEEEAAEARASCLELTDGAVFLVLCPHPAACASCANIEKD